MEGGLRVLGFGPRVYLGDIYLSLRREGHEVRVFAEDAPERRAFGGIIEPVPTGGPSWTGSGATA